MKCSVLLWIFVYLFLDITAFSLLLPWLPSILEQFDDKQRPDVLLRLFDTMVDYLGTSFAVPHNPSWNRVIYGGVLTSILSLAQFFSSPLAGCCSDNYGRKPVLIILEVLNIISYLVSAFWGHRFLWFCVSRFICGAARANVAILTASVSDQMDIMSRTRGMAVVGAAYSVGYTIGPLLSAVWIGRMVSNAPIVVLMNYLGLAAAFIHAIDLMVLCRLFAGPLSAGSGVIRPSDPLSSEVLRLIHPRLLFSLQHVAINNKNLKLLRVCCRVWFAFFIIFSGMEYTLLFLASSRFGYTSHDQGKMFLFMGFVMVIAQGLLVRRFQSGHETILVLQAIFMFGVAVLLVGLAKVHWVFQLGLMFWAIASATFVPTFYGMTSLWARRERQGQVFGIFRSLNALARALGPAVFATIFWAIGPTYAYTLSAILLAILGCYFLRNCFLLL